MDIDIARMRRNSILLNIALETKPKTIVQNKWRTERNKVQKAVAKERECMWQRDPEDEPQENWEDTRHIIQTHIPRFKFKMGTS